MSKRKANRPDLGLSHHVKPGRHARMQQLESKMVNIPEDEKTLLKEVPAKVEGVVIGRALLYDDGSVDVIVAKDAPKEAVDRYAEVTKAFMAGDFSILDKE